VALPHLGQPMNLQIFNGLWILFSRVASMRAEEIRSRILQETRIAILPSKLNASFEYLPFEQRLNIVLVVLFYLEDWPNRFADLIKSAQISLSSLGGDIGSMPFWLSSVLYGQVRPTPFLVS